MTLQASSDANFAKLTASGVVLVDFWAEWCGPCKMMLPRIEELATRIGEKALVLKHNVDENPETPTNLRIMSIPTLILYKDGAPVQKWIGVQDMSVLETAINEHLA